jgi:hypothetical protein
MRKRPVRILVVAKVKRPQSTRLPSTITSNLRGWVDWLLVERGLGGLSSTTAPMHPVRTHLIMKQVSDAAMAEQMAVADA